MNRHTSTFEEWTKEVERLMKVRYGLEPTDFDSPPNTKFSPYDGGDTAEEFVEWYGEKYDFERIDINSNGF